MKHSFRLTLLCLLISNLFVAGARAQSVQAKTKADVELEEVQVRGNTEAERQKKAVYTAPMSSIYMDEQDIQRFKGASQGDILKGQVGVFNGDTRNGALDPNIRGVMGQGRVPVTVDGVDSGISFSRGFYTGNSAATYIDPNLLVSGQIYKGPVISADVKTGSGGGIAFRTIAAKDIIKPGSNFGLVFKTDFNNNTIKPNFPKTIEEKFYAPDHPMFKGIDGFDLWSVRPKFLAPYNINVEAREKNGAFRSGSAMGAVAWRNDKASLMAAYSYRNQGNYFSGKQGAERYENGSFQAVSSLSDYKDSWRLPIARVQLPGREVTNTHNISKTLLLKGTLDLTDNQKLALSYRDTRIKQGAVTSNLLAVLQADYADPRSTMPKGWLPQYPETEIKQKAYNIDYQWSADHPWLNLKVGAYHAENFSHTFTKRGEINDLQMISDPKDHRKTLGFRTGNSRSTKIDQTNRGFRISNTAEITPRLKLLTGLNYNYEKIKPNQYPGVENHSWAGNFPDYRAGSRKESNLYANLNWNPADWVEIDIGAKRNTFHSIDKGYKDFLRSAHFDSSRQEYRDKHRVLGIERYKLFAKDSFERKFGELGVNLGLSKCSNSSPPEDYKMCYDDQVYVWDDKGNAKRVPNAIWIGARWHLRTDSKLHPEDNILANKEFLRDLKELPLPKGEASGKGKNIRYIEGKTNKPYRDFSDNKDAKWSPSLAINFKKFNSNLYIRYAQDYRMPSIYETNYYPSGYLMNRDYTLYSPLKPEKSRNFEIGVGHDFSHWLPSAKIANIKLAYYDNVIKDYIDVRSFDQWFFMDNFDKNQTKGLELQARFDNGKYFVDLSANYNLKHQFCDKQMSYSTANFDNPNGYGTECLAYGPQLSASRHSKTPKKSVNVLLGTRLLNEKLELATRLTYHSSYRLGPYYPEQNSDYVGIPINWSPSTIVDVFGSYRFSKNGTVDLSVTNLTNRYYVDPLARTWMPAPGRTIRAGLKMEF